ncbi:hypothetical protein CBM2626_U10032 [Cupriavidus taiwanensis]|nr:hypothetical protein CBM2614_U20028 [Cupriavidus taiwanensis]SOZ73685.1 hypothetical protein CBM2615_U20011 [Cupriavidus taiwanensis]SOZ75289.1 hypothetical protein CBM2613_U20034 [Cupriavidus taiwanensis]SPA03771.1 hypothetical protein CBM2626_U10032 [Cupriavidus taiwanensis]SPA12597.1 hypothetical protein CBM2625_U10040 [Cupriavidus taiwanensis]
MAKYDEKFKRDIVQRYLSESTGFKALAGEMGLDPSTILGWVNGYTHHGPAGLRKKHAEYDAQFNRSYRGMSHVSVANDLEEQSDVALLARTFAVSDQAPAAGTIN